MKKILFPTDLSETSSEAMQYALAFAAHLDAELFVLHIYELQSTADAFLNLSDSIRQGLEVKIESQIKNACKNLEKVPLVSTSVQAGQPFQIIHQLGKQPDIDLVILFTPGKEWLESFILGSMTREILEAGDFPVLICTPQVSWSPIKKICLPVDSQALASEKDMDALLQIAEGFAAKIMVFHLETDAADLGIHPSFESLFAKPNLQCKVSYHYELSEKSILEAINSFGKEYKADLLCMVKRKRTTFLSIFEKSHTKAEIKKVQMPFLVLPG